MSKKVLVLLEGNNDLKNSCKELLSEAKNASAEIYAMAFGSNAKTLAEQSAHYGATTAFINSNADLDNYNPETYLELVNTWVKDSGAEVVLASSGSLAKDLMPRVAAGLNTGYVSDGTSIDWNDLTVTKPLYAGKCTATVEFQNSPIKFILMRPNQLSINDADTSATCDIRESNDVKTDLKTIIKNIVQNTSEKLDLTEANIIVAGGRGMKEADNFKMLDDLAGVLGATVGASRAVCDAGWVPHSMQVGQTGKTVAPNLYIACGISGAIQHLAGMSSSKVIVAINNDPEAPIFQKATYGIVGDLFEVVPKLTEEFKKVL